MEFGIIGLGRMGANITRRAIEQGRRVVGWSQNAEDMDALAGDGFTGAKDLTELVAQLSAPRIVFIYVPHGKATEEVCNNLRGLLSPGDIVVDGGNSHWEDSRRRHMVFGEHGINFLDVGTSGGISGARNGACFMAGGDRDVFHAIAPILRDLAIDDEAVVYAGPAGAGHFAKLVHNAIEFGMIQSIAEGVELLARSEYKLDAVSLLSNWNHGSVIRSWLVDLMAQALLNEDNFEGLSTYVEDTDEVKWVLNWALDQDIPTPVIGYAQQALMQYRDLDWPAAKAVALLRHGFGGHPVHRLEGARARR